MLPLVIQYLQTHSLDNLLQEHGVNHRWDTDHTKICLNYDMLLYKPGDKLAEECRGLIIRPYNKFSGQSNTIVGDCGVIAWPMNKFYNQGETHAASIDLSTMLLYEKLDGTMISLYWDELKNNWCISTRGVPEADIPIRLGDLLLEDKTFYDLFIDALKETLHHKGISFTTLSDFCDSQHFDHNITYVFELTTPHNRVVVEYIDSNITLLAARNIVTGIEIPIKNIETIIDKPKIYDVHHSSFSAISAFADTFQPNVLEGFVATDSQFNRVKIKNSKWVFTSRVKDNIVSSKRNVIVSILNGTLDDILPFIDKQSKEILLQLSINFKVLISNLDSQCVQLCNEYHDNKTFALTIQEKILPLQAGFFSVKRNKAKTILEWLIDLNQKNKLSNNIIDEILNLITKRQ